MTYYYARVSTKEQNLARQIKAFKELGAEENEIICDKESGKNFDRKGYKELKAKLQDGDEVYIVSLDRLGRSKEETKAELKYFKENGIRLKVLDLPTTLIEIPQGNEWILDMVNNILIEVLSSIAEQERKTILERQRKGIDAMPIINGKRISAKTGRGFGREYMRVPDFTELKGKTESGEISVKEAYTRLGISRSKWYSLCREVA